MAKAQNIWWGQSDNGSADNGGQVTSEPLPFLSKPFKVVPP